MEKSILFIAILFFSNLNYGQVAIIKDKDGFTNVRKEPNVSSEIIYKIMDSEIFSYEETKSEWITIYIEKSKYQLQCEEDRTLVGFIHKSRLNPIQNLEISNGTDFSFKYKIQEFNFENKICDYNGEWLTKINGRRIYGTDGNIPETEVTGIDVSMNGTNINISNVLYEDIFECDNEMTIYKNKGDYIVYQWNSDGAGGYLIVWVFGNEKLKQRMILIP